MGRLSVGPVWGEQEAVLQTTHPATPPAIPERITWSAAFILESSGLIQVQCTRASRPSMWGFTLTDIRCSGPDRSSCDSGLHTHLDHASKANSGVRVKALKGQNGTHLCSVLLANNDPSYILANCALVQIGPPVARNPYMH